MIDFNTTNLVLVAYPNYAGGKFLINSLGLSDQACLQHSVLAQLQLDDRLPPSDKLKFLLARLNGSHYFWDDLGLGCLQLFGRHDEFGTTFGGRTNDTQLPEYIIRLLSSKLKLFKACHTASQLSNLAQRWPNAPIVLLKNSADVARYRKRNNIDAVKINEQAIYQQVTNINRTYIEWDCNNFFNFDKFDSSLKIMYNSLGLNDYDRNQVKQLFDEYHWAWDSTRDLVEYEKT